MKPVANLLWWAAYTAAALLLQQQFPGLDALTPVFLLSLQEGNSKQTFWLFLLFTLIQEGAGSLTFGMGMLWYGGQICIFRIGSRLFVADNLLSVGMLSVGLGLYYSGLLWLMCALQDVPLDYALLLHEGILQTAAIPLVWSVCRLLRPKKVPQHVY